MNSVRVLYYLFFPAGGIGKYSHRQLQGLAQFEDLNLELVCLPDYQWRNTELYPNWPGLFGISSRFPPLRKARFLLGQFVNPRRLLHHANDVQADLIHIGNINYLSFPTWTPLLDRWGGKLVCTAHDVCRRVPILHRKFEQKQLQRFYRRCDAIFVHSDEQQSELRHFAGVNEDFIYVVPHGPTEFAALDPADSVVLRRRLGIPQGHRVALLFGFLREDKNLHGFISAIAKTERDDLHLVIAGSVATHGESYLRRCRALVRELDIEARVHFEVSYIPDQEVPQWFGLCDLVVCTHTEEFSSQSGVLNLAAFYERPVLATPTASVREMLLSVDIGLLCEGFTEGDIATGLVDLCTRLERREAFDFAAYREQFSWSRNAELTHRVYRHLLDAA